MKNEFLKEALKKLDEGAQGTYDKYGEILKKPVSEALSEFCKQEPEFAQAVVQGGEYKGCLENVRKAVKNNAISDIETYRQAVSYYFPGADVKFVMTIDLCASVDSEEKAEPMVLDLSAFL